MLDTILFEANEAIMHIEKKGVSILRSISVIICRKKYEREGKNKTNYTHTHIIKCVILKALIPNFKRKKSLEQCAQCFPFFKGKWRRKKKRHN